MRLLYGYVVRKNISLPGQPSPPYLNKCRGRSFVSLLSYSLLEEERDMLVFDCSK